MKIGKNNLRDVRNLFVSAAFSIGLFYGLGIDKDLQKVEDFLLNKKSAVKTEAPKQLGADISPVCGM